MKKNSNKIIDKEAIQNSLYFLKRSGQYFRPYTWRIIFSLISMGIVGACTGLAAFLVQPALDDIFINKDKQALLTIPLLVILVFACKGLFRVTEIYHMQYSALKVLEQLRNDLYAKMIKLPVGFFETSHVGMLMSRIINDVNLLRNSIPEIISLLRQAITMIALIFVAFYRDAFLATWAIIVLPLAFLPLIYFGRKLRRVGRRNQAKIADISTILQEIFSAIRVVKAFAMEGAERRKFRVQNEKLVNIALKGTFYTALSSPVMEFIGALGMGAVIWYGGTQVIAGQSTPGTFFSFLTALMMLYEPVKHISKSNLNIQKALAGAERVFEILDSEEIQEEKQGRIELKPPFKQLSFINVSFCYPDCTENTLTDINLEIKPGQRVAIVGPSGAGKTSLVHLIPGFYRPQKGSIVLNGRDLSDYTLKSLRRFIGMVSQETVLFNATIRDNLTYGLPEVDQAKLERVCKTAYAHDFINRLPQGYQTEIGERGVKLSGGEKQRITIARALLKDPALLILDEATSALDTESEIIVQQALENLMHKRTSIVIAHRLSTVLSADKILVMSQGRIQDLGTHQELIARCSLYQKLYSLQFEIRQEDMPAPKITATAII